MSLTVIHRALRKRLLQLTALPVLATSWENVNFTPVVGVPYQRTTFMPNGPDNSTMGSALYLMTGRFQVDLFYPTGESSIPATERAELLQKLFMRGTTLAESGLSITVTLTPRIAQGGSDGDRFHIPVIVNWQCFIAT